MVFKVRTLVTRCFLQKNIRVNDKIVACPVEPAGFKGEITYARNIFTNKEINFTAKTRQKAFDELSDTQHGALVIFSDVEANSAEQAIELIEVTLEVICGTLSILTESAVTPICSQSGTDHQPVFKFYFPKDPKFKHAINVPGFIDAIPGIFEEARKNPKLNVLLRLFRSAQQENDVDYQILFYLILLEEASDVNPGSLAERMRSLFANQELSEYVNRMPSELGISLPKGKDFIDVLVKLRNSAAHNGTIEPASIEAKYVKPFLADKEKLAGLLREVVRVVIATMVGFGPSQKSLRIKLKPGESFEIKF